MQPTSARDTPLAGFVAGLLAGIARVTVGHPFDTVKVLTQTGQVADARSLLRPTWKAFVRLYRGIGPPLLTVCATTGTSFSLYEGALLALQPLALPSSIKVFTAGTLSGVALALPFCPLSNVRVLQQTSAEKKNIAAWLHQLYCHRGPRAWFRGLMPNLVQGGVGRGFYMATFHMVKEIEDTSGYISSDDFSGKLLAASSAGIAGWVFTYPFDVARSNIIRDWQCRQFSGAMFPALLQIYRRGGISQLYAGLSYTVCRAVPVAAVTLTTYDISKAAVLHSIDCHRRDAT
eukprot:TRINITY_DN2184_c0_g1_i1.p1 TRINITY_DN2184_c0_g1~~TRINITY_DN2184_c0_g1_i1.p1  ORF type:complete len:289 (+),score=27.30 TRINITY_DN2184_c0_g1_i1:133-999(+)